MYCVNIELLIIGKCWHRYSNTLLLSLNNRISIREELAARKTLPTSGALVSPTFNVLESSVMHAELEMQIEMSPLAFKGRKLSEVQDKVIGGYCGTSFTNFHSTPGPPDLTN